MIRSSKAASAIAAVLLLLGETAVAQTRYQTVPFNTREPQTTAVQTKIKAVPFKIVVPQAKLDEIRQRVQAYEWQDMPAINGWKYGVNLSYMKELTDYWVNQYNWRKYEQQMNRFKHFKAIIDGEQLHFIHEKGSGRNRQPLLLIHGWPYSFYSFIDVIEPLAHPERFGGNAEDGFDVIVVSLPGFGFSDKPAKPIGPRAMSERMNRLMTEMLGYDRYIVQGGDWGAHIAAWMAFNYPQHVKGLHLNGVFVRHHGAAEGSGQTGSESATAEERAFVERERKLFSGPDYAYSKLQASRPQTLSYAMMDSPVGGAAWIIEKYYLWSDKRQRPFEQIFTKDRLLTEVMTYLVTDTFNTSTWIYAGFVTEPPATLPPGEKIKVPTAIASFPDPFTPPPPRSLAQRAYNIVQWTDMPRGAHLAPIEEPNLFVSDLRQFGRLLKSSSRSPQ